MSDKRELLLQGAAQLGINLGPEAVARLLVYLAELMKWSRRINLIARDTPEHLMIENHFLDSLTLVPLLQAPDAGASARCRHRCRFSRPGPGLRPARSPFYPGGTAAETGCLSSSPDPHPGPDATLRWLPTGSNRRPPTGRGGFPISPAGPWPNRWLFLPLIRSLVIPATRVVLMLAKAEALVGIEQIPRLLADRRYHVPDSAVLRCAPVAGHRLRRSDTSFWNNCGRSGSNKVFSFPYNHGMFPILDEDDYGTQNCDFSR